MTSRFFCFFHLSFQCFSFSSLTFVSEMWYHDTVSTVTNKAAHHCDKKGWCSRTWRSSGKWWHTRTSCVASNEGTAPAPSSAQSILILNSVSQECDYILILWCTQRKSKMDEIRWAKCCSYPKWNLAFKTFEGCFFHFTMKNQRLDHICCERIPDLSNLVIAYVSSTNLFSW